MRTLAIRVAALVAIASVALSAQQGTATLAGVVIADDRTAQPIRRAVVTISGGGLSMSRSLITDADGRFAFTNLPAGRYAVKAWKGGFLPTTVGARRGAQQGVPITVGDGERISDVTVRLPRGAVITGTVTTSNGEPVPGLQVIALSVHGDAPTRIALMSPFVTDDRGVYRIHGLLPDDYIVAAAPPRQAGPNAAAARSAAQVDAIFRQLREMVRGTTVAGAPSSRPGPATPDPATSAPATHGYSPIFFPGTPSATDAVAVRVAAGQERSGVDIVWNRVPTASIVGVVTNAHGPLPRVMVSITPEGPRLPGVYGGAPTLTHPVGADGRFQYSGVAPGRYTLFARATASASTSSPMVGRAGSGGQPQGPSGQLLWAMAQLTVQGEEVAVSLDLQPPLRFTGRIDFEGDGPSPDLKGGGVVTVSRERAGGTAVLNTTAIGYPNVPPAVIRPDGTFELVGVLPGTYRVSATITGAPAWKLRSAIVGGRDVLDVPLAVGARDVTDAVLTLSNRETELAGRVRMTAGPATATATVVAFPVEPSLWLPGARRVQAATVDRNGDFAIRGLPGGEYFVVVLPDVDTFQLNDRTFLQQLAQSSVRITLKDGESTRQDLHVRQP